MSENPEIIVKISADIAAAKSAVGDLTKTIKDLEGQLKAASGGKPFEGVANDAKLTFSQVESLRGAFFDLFGTISSGGSVMTGLTQQFGQVAQAATAGGGPTQLIKGALNALAQLVTPARLGALAILGIGAALTKITLDSANESNKIKTALLGIGSVSGQTVASIKAIGDELGATGLISSKTAKEVALALATTGNVRGDNVAAITKLTPGYANLTGQSASEAGKQLAKNAQDATRYLETMQAATGAVDGKTQEYIRTLIRQGQAQEAIAVTTKSVAAEIAKAADATDNWTKIWNKLKEKSGNVLDEIGEKVARAGGLIKESPTQEAESGLKALEQKRKDAVEQRDQSKLTIFGYGGASPESLAAADANIKKIDEEIAAQKRLIETRKTADATSAKDKVANLAAGEVQKALESNKTIEKSINELTDEYAKLDTKVNEAGTSLSSNQISEAKDKMVALQAEIKKAMDDLAKGGEVYKNALNTAEFEKSIASLSGYEQAQARINHTYDETLKKIALINNEEEKAAATKAAAAVREKALGTLKESDFQKTVSNGGQGNNESYIRMLSKFEGVAGQKNPQSSASGYFQFIKGTWLQEFKETFPREFQEVMKTGGEEGVLALRNNLDKASAVLDHFTSKNVAKLKEIGFGGEINDSVKYSMHLMGSAGMAKKLWEGDRDAPLTSIGMSADAVAKNRNATGSTIGSAQDYFNRASAQSDSGVSGSRRQIAAQRELGQTYGQSTAAVEALKQVQEALDNEVKKGSTAGNYIEATGLTASKLMSSKEALDQMPPAVRALAEEYRKLAAERAAASEAGDSTKFGQDLANMRTALTRSDSENTAYTKALSYGGGQGTALTQQRADALQMLDTMKQIKDTASGAMTGFVLDLSHGVKAGDALKNMVTKMADKLLTMGSDAIFSKLFGSLTGGSAAGGGGKSKIGALVGKANGGWMGAGPRGFSEGGNVFGAGTATSDSIPAMLSHGEFVVKASAAGKNRALLEQINSGKIGHYATGGAVGRPTSGSAPPVRNDSEGTSQSMTMNTFHTSINVPAGTDPKDGAKLAKYMDAMLEQKIRKTQMDQRRPRVLAG